MATAITETRLMSCQSHMRDYPQVLFSRTSGEEVWVGECDACRDEANLLNQARQMEKETSSETYRQVEKIVASSEKQIAAQVQLEIDEYVESVRQEAEARRFEWTADVRRRVWDDAVSSVQAERAAQFVEQLRKAR